MSIENQTIGISDIEVLMIDDCSSDNTYSIIKEYSNKFDVPTWFTSDITHKSNNVTLPFGKMINL